MSKAASTRRQWKKYGNSIDDPPGPNSFNTICCEDVYMQFVSCEDDENMDKDDPLQNLSNKCLVKCQYCEMDHWTLKCPHKDKFELKRIHQDKSTAKKANHKNKCRKKCLCKDDNQYFPLNVRQGVNNRGDLLVSKDEAKTIRVTNLPEEIRKCNIKDLFHQFGKIVRISLPKDRYTGQSKGFAFVRFDRSEDATKAIKQVNGFGYANLILNVEWASDANRKSKVNELIQLKNYSQFYGQRYTRSSVEVLLRSQDLLKKMAQKMRTRDKKRLKDPSLKSFEGSKKHFSNLYFF
ncbi:eukaryotic translation initiation factor 3 subunit G-like [Panonychus citri]|uniref:eukaryotic translation initiation factor 3 subunit G-like n=1 Tax=Panonychus citri TaxID=50023 RepID=UPI002306E26E|nr:eukaryotic translation initiation factor 3 subunit G-like [Panonychus citri]